MTTAPDKPKNGLIFAMLIVSVITVVGLGITIQQLFNLIVTGQISEKQLEPVPSTLKALREEEARKLGVGQPGRYVWADQKAGAVRIPLDSAMELTLRDWSKRSTAPVSPSDAANAAPAPTTPAPAPAPTTPSPAGDSKPAGETAPKAAPAPANTPPR